jgi:hypothetical protein
MVRQAPHEGFVGRFLTHTRQTIAPPNRHPTPQALTLSVSKGEVDEGLPTLNRPERKNTAGPPPWFDKLTMRA